MTPYGLSYLILSPYFLAIAYLGREGGSLRVSRAIKAKALVVAVLEELPETQVRAQAQNA